MLCALLCFAACDNKFIATSGTKGLDEWHDVPAKPLSSSEITVLAIQQRYTTGSFGYETFVNESCVGDYVYNYGYVLSECASTSASTSLRYDWCGAGDDGMVYFNMVRYNSVNCVGTPSWNFTYSVSAACDKVNAKKPICIPTTEGWLSYGLKQHST